jgi:hypothetical protein
MNSLEANVNELAGQPQGCPRYGGMESAYRKRQ